MDWKQTVSQILETESAKQARLVTERENQSKSAAKEKEHADLLKLQQNFKCHICQKPATKPGERCSTHGSNSCGENAGETTDWHIDWDIPGDLHKCEDCHKWTCEDDILTIKRALEKVQEYTVGFDPPYLISISICKQCWSKRLGLKL